MPTGAGSSIGSILGGVAGSAIPGLGTAAGSAAGNILGGGIDSLIAGRKETASVPLLEDPQQRLLLEEIRGKRKSLEQGTDMGTQAAIGEADVSGESARNAIVRATAGNAGQTIDALLKSQGLENRAKNSIVATSQARLPFMQNLEEQLQDKIAQRQLDLQMFNRVSNAAEKAQYGKESLMNLMAGTANGTFDPIFNAAGNGVNKIAEVGGNAAQQIGTSVQDSLPKIADFIKSLRGENNGSGSEFVVPTIPQTVSQIKGL